MFEIKTIFLTMAELNKLKVPKCNLKKVIYWISKLGEYGQAALSERPKFAIFDTLMSLKLNVYQFSDQNRLLKAEISKYML